MNKEEYNNLKIGDWVVRQGSGILRRVTGICRYDNTLRISDGKYCSYLQYFPINENYLNKQITKLTSRINYKITRFDYNEETKVLSLKIEPRKRSKDLRGLKV